jgi:hypothetical protein
MHTAASVRGDTKEPVVMPIGEPENQTIRVTHDGKSRTIFKAENILMDTYGPPAYVPRTHKDGKPFSIQDLRGAVMQERCEAMDSWLDNVGERD